MVKTNSSSVLKFEVDGRSQVGHVGWWMLGGFTGRLRVGDVLSEAFGASSR